MNLVTVLWTLATVAFAALCAAGGGHPPGVILVPFVFAAWLAGAVVSELVSWWLAPERSLRRPSWFLATAAPLFVAVSAIGLHVKDTHEGENFFDGWDAWTLMLGPVLLVWTLASFWQLRSERRSMASLLLAGLALLVLWLALD